MPMIDGHSHMLQCGPLLDAVDHAVSYNDDDDGHGDVLGYCTNNYRHRNNGDDHCYGGETRADC